MVNEWTDYVAKAMTKDGWGREASGTMSELEYLRYLGGGVKTGISGEGKRTAE